MPELDRLRAEDAPVFERILDSGLNTQEISEAVHRTGGTLNAEQLRDRALAARATIVSTAATEYHAYLRLRASAARAVRPAQQAAETPTRTGGGLLPALGVLVPGLSATAAVIFLLFGCGLRAVGIHAHLADELISAGLTAAGVAAAATLIGLLRMLVAAARNRSTEGAGDADAAGDTGSAAMRAHEAWQQALLERGVMPFLLGLLDDAASAGRPSGSKQQGRRTGPST